MLKEILKSISVAVTIWIATKILSSFRALVGTLSEIWVLVTRKNEIIILICTLCQTSLVFQPRGSFFFFIKKRHLTTCDSNDLGVCKGMVKHWRLLFLRTRTRRSETCGSTAPGIGYGRAVPPNRWTWRPFSSSLPSVWSCRRARRTCSRSPTVRRRLAQPHVPAPPARTRKSANIATRRPLGPLRTSQNVKQQQRRYCARRVCVLWVRTPRKGSVIDAVVIRPRWSRIQLNVCAIDKPFFIFFFRVTRIRTVGVTVYFITFSRRGRPLVASSRDTSFPLRSCAFSDVPIERRNPSSPIKARNDAHVFRSLTATANHSPTPCTYGHHLIRLVLYGWFAFQPTYNRLIDCLRSMTYPKHMSWKLRIRHCKHRWLQGIT